MLGRQLKVHIGNYLPTEIKILQGKSLKPYLKFKILRVNHRICLLGIMIQACMKQVNCKLSNKIQDR